MRPADLFRTSSFSAASAPLRDTRLCLAEALSSRRNAALLLALILGARPGFADEPQAARSEPFTASAFQKHVEYLSSDELQGRNVDSPGWSKAADYVIQHFKAAGLKPLKDDGSWFQEFPVSLSVLPGGKATARNILAVFPGRGELKDQAVIVSAHLDHLGTKSDAKAGEDAIFNGADDNASGVAAMLLIAQALHQERNKLPQSYRTLIFASFDAEERGLQGSRYYEKHPVWPLEQTAAVVNFDSMGRLRMGKVYASDAETNPVLAQAVTDAAKVAGLVAETRFGGHGRSDHAIFLDREIPGMHFFTGANSDYHQVTDESPRLNMEGGAGIAWIGWQVTRTAMIHPERLEFQKANPVFDMQFLLNVVRSMGIVPALNAQDGRYPQILFVLPNTPAAKYGMQAGDQITAINGTQLNRVEDALTLFQQLTFDQGLRLSVLRSGKDAEVQIPASFFEEMSGPKATELKSGSYEVTFNYRPEKAGKTVYLAGNFNEWNPMALRMDGPNDQGAFTTKLELKPGVYEYKFVHEGTDWFSDPRNLYQVGKHSNSVLLVGKQR